MKKSIIALSALTVLLLSSCLGSKHATASGGEVTGVSEDEYVPQKVT